MPLNLAKKMDPRVKPAGDRERMRPILSVIAGLDPAIHPLTKIPLSLAKNDGPAGQARG